MLANTQTAVFIRKKIDTSHMNRKVKEPLEQQFKVNITLINWIKNTILTRCSNEKDKQFLNKFEAEITKTVKQLQAEDQNWDCL